MDQHLVTNVNFASFVEATGYVTVAERPPSPGEYPDIDPGLLEPGSLVFRPPPGRVGLHDVRLWWAYVPGACWRQPEGPGSNLNGRHDHPVVHVAYEDAQAFAGWRGKELPTEAEGVRRARKPGWRGVRLGDELAPQGRILANTWQGEFPWQNLRTHGYEGTSTVGAFPPNGYGLHDMAGNVWEWTADDFAPHAAALDNGCCIPRNDPLVSPEQSHVAGTSSIQIRQKVLKGGSHLERAQLLLSLQASRASAPNDRYLGVSHRFSLRRASSRVRLMLGCAWNVCRSDVVR
jgi:sulfatase modifying factor 1